MLTSFIIFYIFNLFLTTYYIIYRLAKRGKCKAIVITLRSNKKSRNRI